MKTAKYVGLFLMGAASLYGIAIILGTISLKSLDFGVDIFKDMYDV